MCISVVLVTHETDIARHARRLVQVRDGHIVADRAVQRRMLATEWLKFPENTSTDLLEL
ncbi:MAG TPA: hypothetical protein VK689_09115 [Armatimonadota bacterium]|nr:hypothetical protein [Armatimonadota bacterium]